MNDLCEPYDWYWSGLNWYCKVSRGWGTKVAVGAGKTKEAAEADARRVAAELDRQYQAYRANYTAENGTEQ